MSSATVVAFLFLFLLFFEAVDVDVDVDVFCRLGGGIAGGAVAGFFLRPVDRESMRKISIVLFVPCSNTNQLDVAEIEWVLSFDLVKIAGCKNGIEFLQQLSQREHDDDDENEDRRVVANSKLFFFPQTSVLSIALPRLPS